jgi:alpha-L-fucosidase 2
MDLTDWCARQRVRMPAAAARFDTESSEGLGRHNLRWTGPAGPSGFWVEGAPLGNGDFGALVYGGPENLTFLLGKTDLWVRRTERSYCFPPGVQFSDLARAYREQDREAFRRWTEADGKRPYQFAASHLTGAGVLRLHLAEPAGLQSFAQELDLAEATCYHRWLAPCQGYGYMEPPDWEVMSFASAPHEALVIRLRRAVLPLGSFTWRLGRERHPALPECLPGAEGELCWFEQELLKGDAYAVAMLAMGARMACQVGQRSVTGESLDDDRRQVTFYLAAASTEDTADPLALAVERVQRAASAGVDELHGAHRRYWADFWGQSRVYCADELAERGWYLSNYLCGSILRPGKVSPGLQGVWIKENVPAWNADFHGNINIQALYWGLFGGNRLDLLEPYVSLYHRMLPQCRADTAAFYQTEGARLPHAGDLDGYEMSDHEAFTLGTSLAPSGWIAQLLWWGYEYSGDREFLAQAAYPVLSEVAKFYWGVLEQMGKGSDGRYRVEPTIFMEIAYRTLEGWGTNSSYEVPIIRMNLEQARAAAEILGVEAEWQERWRQALQALPDLPIGEDGGWEAWEGRGGPQGGHGASGPFLTPVFPCRQVSAFHGPEQLRRHLPASYQQFLTRIESPWCGGSPVATCALMGDADRALELARFPKQGELRNGLVNDWQGVFMQADHGPGMALALNSMMLLSLEETIILFPALPPAVDAGFYSLRAPGPVLVSAEQRGGRVRYAACQSLTGGTLRVANPFLPEGESTVAVRVTRMDTGETISEVRRAYREVVAWEAAPGVVYVLEESG